MDASSAPLCFTIEVFEANFVTPGRYFLILGITGSKVNPSAWKLYVGDSKVPLNDGEFSTNACLKDGVPETLVTFKDSVIFFWMPPGSADGDIKLVVEAFQLPENPLHEGDKYGEAVFDVFPRKGALFSAVRQKTPSSRDSKELYQFETNITLSQVLKDEGFSANTGIIRAAISLKQDELKKEGDKYKRTCTKVTDKLEVDNHRDDSLVRRVPEHAAGILKNACPSHELTEVKSRTSAIKHSQSKEKEKKTKYRDPVAQRQEGAGSLANFCSSIELGFDVEERKRRKRKNRGYSSANFCPGITVYSDSPVSETKDFKVKWEDDEEENVISIWENSSQESASQECISPHLVQKQEAELANSCNSDEGDRAELDIEKHCSDEEQDRFVAERFRKGYFVDMQLGNYLSNGIPEDHMTDSSQVLMIPKSRRTAQDSSHLVEKQKRKVIRRVSDRNNEAAAFACYKQTQSEPVKDPGKEPEHVKPKLLPVPGDPGPGPSSASDTSTAIKTIQETALGTNVNSTPVQHLCGSYLTREGFCEVIVLAHGALGLPMKSDGRPPQPYIAGKSGKAEAQNQMGQSVTHASIQPTQSPSWEEILLIEFREEESKDEVVILLLADHPSKELLTEYTVPLTHLKPFHQYHLELVQPNPELSGDTRLYITLMMKMDKLPLPSVGSKVYGLEVLLRSLEAPVSSHMGPLVATGKIVVDWKEYKETMLSSQPRLTGVTVTTIDFPSPHPTSFAVAGATPAQGAPQVTTAGTPQEQPQWNQTLFFVGDESSLFTATSALVIEYYPASLAMSRDSWQLSSPVGYSYQTLDQLLLSSLKWDSSRLGLSVDNLPVEGSNLRTAIGTSPTVGIVLRLVTSERPDQQLTAAHLSSLPVFRTVPAQQQTQQAQPLHTTQQTPYGLPPMNAVKTILPQFHSLYNAGPRSEPVKEYVPLENLSSPNVSAPPDRRSVEAAGIIQIPPEVRGKMDIRDLAVMDYQMKEVDRYRTAMRKMATDLLHVREDCKRLEEANSRLRRELGQRDEISRLMVSSKDLDNVTHTELVQKFVLLKKKLADESSKKQDLQTRLQHLQNDLIKKNEMEKEFLKLQEAHEGQQALLQKMQGKVQNYKTIQDTCKKQEKVIVQLEQLLAKQGKGQYNGETNDTYRTLSEENIKLQAEVMQYKELLKTAEAKQKLPRSPDKHVAKNGPMSDMERLELYEKLEKAEGRIVALEKQLAYNVRKWAKDKADLQMKLNESVLGQKTGYKNSYSSTSIDILDWHNGPKPSSPSRPLGPRRPSPKLDPLERR